MTNQDTIMEISTITEPCFDDIRGVRIVSGLTPNDMEAVLNMAAVSGVFSSDIMMTAEDMAWDCAYGDGSEQHMFLKAVTTESGMEKTIGFICYGPIPRWTESYELYGIVVETEYHRLGIGTGLVAEMRRQILAEHGKQIFLETGSDRIFEGARLFYEANEFVYEHRFYKQFPATNGGIIYRLGIDADLFDEQYQ